MDDARYMELPLRKNHIPPRLKQGRLILDDFGHRCFEDQLELDDYGNRYQRGSMVPDIDFYKLDTDRQ